MIDLTEVKWFVKAARLSPAITGDVVMTRAQLHKMSLAELVEVLFKLRLGVSNRLTSHSSGGWEV